MMNCEQETADLSFIIPGQHACRRVIPSKAIASKNCSPLIVT